MIRNNARSKIITKIESDSEGFLITDGEEKLFLGENTELSSPIEVFIEAWKTNVVIKREAVLIDSINGNSFSISQRACEFCVQNDSEELKLRSNEALSFDPDIEEVTVSMYFSEKSQEDLGDRLKNVEDNKLSKNDNTITKQGNSFNGANELLKLNSEGKVPSENLPPSEMDISVLDEVVGNDEDFMVVNDGGGNKKLSLKNSNNILGKYPLGSDLKKGSLVKLKEDGKIDKLSFKNLTESNLHDNVNFTDGYPNSIFKIDDNHIGIYTGQYTNGSNIYSRPTITVYEILSSGELLKKDHRYLTSSTNGGNASNSDFYVIAMGSNVFFFSYMDSSRNLYGVVGSFNPDNAAFSFGGYTQISSSGDGYSPSGCRMSDTTLLLKYNGLKIRKVTINPTSKTITSTGNVFNIPDSATRNGQGYNEPLTSWAEDVAMTTFVKFVGGKGNVYACKITCSGDNLTFSDETLCYSHELSYDTYIRGGVSNYDLGKGDSTKLVWVGQTGSGPDGISQVIKYNTETDTIEAGNDIQHGRRRNQDFVLWHDGKICISEYCYNGSENGRHISIVGVDGIESSVENKLYPGSTYVKRAVYAKGNVYFVYNNESSNKFVIGSYVMNMKNFFGILQENGLTGEEKKVAKIGNISSIHNGLTPGSGFSYGLALNSKDILIFRNT